MTSDMRTEQHYEVAIVGGNFAGLQAALTLSRARRRVVLFDIDQHRNRFAAHSHGFLGHDGKSPAQIRAEALADLQRYPAFRQIKARVHAVSGQKDAFHLAHDGGALTAQRVILATGQRDILPDVPGLAECWGITANQCPYCHGYELADRPTGILLGDHPQAGHYLRQIRRWAGELTVFDNGAVLAPETVAAIAELGHVHVSGRFLSLDHVAGRVSAIRVEGQAPVALEALYLASRTEPAASFAADLGCEMTDGHSGPLVWTDTWQRTSVPGVFAAGDLASQPPSAVFATASGATAGFGCDMDMAGLLPP